MDRITERERTLTRRRFLGVGGLTTAAVLLGTSTINSHQALANPSFLDDPFKLGVASGDPLPNGVVLWTRLAPDPFDPSGGMPPEAFGVRYEVAEDPAFQRIRQRGTVEAMPELAHSVHAEVTGLLPGREYYYRFKAGPEISPVGRTKTAPAVGESVSAFKFAFASCQMYEHGYFTAYRHMASEDLDVVLHLGDSIYEHGPNQYRAASGNVRQHIGPEVSSLFDYRRRHAQYRTDPDLQAAHAAFPWIVTLDDHEIDNNWADEIPERNQSIEAFRQRRINAFQAYYEHMPLRSSAVPHGLDMQLYRRATFGDMVEFSVLDTRQYRDDQACGDGVDVDCADRLDPSRSIMGFEQERWLSDGLGRSNARWNVIAQQVVMAQFDHSSGPEQAFQNDIWDGYKPSRDRLFTGLIEQNVRNPVVLTGDVHRNLAMDLKSDFDNPDSTTIGVEFAGTSISSGGDGQDTDASGLTFLAANPHFKFNNTLRGYVRCSLTSSQGRTDYRVLPYVSQPGAPVSTRKSFIVEEGKPGLQDA